MKTIIGVVVLLSIMVSGVRASGTFLTKVDGFRGGEPCYSAALLLPEGEIWALGLNNPKPTIEVGKLFPAKIGDVDVCWGGYFSAQRNDNYIEPFVGANKKIGNVCLSAALFYYIPLKDGVHSLGSPGVSAMVPVTDKVSAGLTGTFWEDPGCHQVNYGPQVTYCGEQTVTARWLPWGNNGTTFKVETCLNF